VERYLPAIQLLFVFVDEERAVSGHHPFQFLGMSKGKDYRVAAELKQQKREGNLKLKREGNIL
jgi:hypothetical protein